MATGNKTCSTWRIVISDPKDSELGGTFPVYFQSGTADGVELQIPVLDAAGRPWLEPLVPTPAAAAK